MVLFWGEGIEDEELEGVDRSGGKEDAAFVHKLNSQRFGSPTYPAGNHLYAQTWNSAPRTGLKMQSVLNIHSSYVLWSLREYCASKYGVCSQGNTGEWFLCKYENLFFWLFFF